MTPVERCLRNLEEHNKWLLAIVKELQRDRDTDRAEIKRLRERVERGDSE